jgi:hypothetical protein
VTFKTECWPEHRADRAAGWPSTAMNSTSISFDIWGGIARRLAAFAACIMLGLVLFVVTAHTVKEVVRQPPSFDELLTLEGRVSWIGRCSGKRARPALDVGLATDWKGPVVRVPCTPEFLALQVGAPLKLHVREVHPLFDDPPYADVWHASSSGTVLYSYEARLARTKQSNWLFYPLEAFLLLLVWFLFWKLLKRALEIAKAGSE